MTGELRLAAARWREALECGTLDYANVSDQAIEDLIVMARWAAPLLAEREGRAALESKLEEAEKSIACYRQHLGDVVTYGMDAESLDKKLQEWVLRARKAEEENEQLRTENERLRALINRIGNNILDSSDEPCTMR